MTDELLQALLALPDAIDALTARISASNAKLKEQALATRAILAELGIGAVSGVAAVSLSPSQPVAPLTAPLRQPPDPHEDEARAEQLRYLESRKAERAALLAQNRNGEA